jgi:predicted amidohydrolase YtcJ
VLGAQSPCAGPAHSPEPGGRAAAERGERAGLLFDYLVDTVFNYPTPAEAYRVAALDAVNKLRAVAGLN